MADNKMIKMAGEHWVCAVLARHGWAAALTRDGLERTDILAVNTGPGRRMVEVQVKTASFGGARTSWLLGEKSVRPAQSDREWYALVQLAAEPNGLPATYVVPRDHVAAATWIVHQNWLTDPSVPAGKRNAPISRARVDDTVWRLYQDRWDLLAEPADKAPVLLPSWLKERAGETRVGLPPGHPWLENLPAWE